MGRLLNSKQMKRNPNEDQKKKKKKMTNKWYTTRLWEIKSNWLGSREFKATGGFGQNRVMKPNDDDDVIVQTIDESFQKIFSLYRSLIINITNVNGVLFFVCKYINPKSCLNQIDSPWY